MSEYLDRLKHLRDAKTPVGAIANVQTNISFRKAIDYIEVLESQIEDFVGLVVGQNNLNKKVKKWIN